MSNQQEKLLKLAEAMENPASFAYKETERLDDKIDTEVTRIDESIKTISLTPGDKGEKGDKGDTGEKGLDGKDGKDGVDGKDGRDGKDGLNGKDGVDGINGEDGIDGEKGDKGDKGNIPDHKWEKTTLYFEKPDGKWGKGVDLEGPEGQTIIKRIASGGGSGGGTGTVTGTGTANQVAYWNGTSSLTGDTDLTFDGTNLMVGNVTSVRRVNIDGSLRFKSYTAAGNVLMYVGTSPIWVRDTNVNIFLAGAGNLTLTGGSNFGIGSSMQALTTGILNFGVGSAMSQLTEGNYNLGIGAQTLPAVTTGENNTAIGSGIQAFYGVGTQTANTYIGAQVNFQGSALEYNTLIGAFSVPYSEGSYNTFIGAHDVFGGYGLIYGSHNIGIGYSPLIDAADPSYTIAIGDDAARSSAGSNAIYIGYNLPGTSTNYELIIGNNSNYTITGNLSTKSVAIGINPASITARLHLPAGTTSASSAPLKFTSGSLLTSAEAGAVEFLTDKAYLTITTGAARKELTLNDAALTSGRVPFATTNGRLTDDADLTFATDTLSATKVAMSSLTSGRVPIVSTAGLLIDDADLTFATDTLTSTKIVGTTSVKVGTAAGYISSDGSTGATGTFSTADGYTVTFKDGIITSIV